MTNTTQLLIDAANPISAQDAIEVLCKIQEMAANHVGHEYSADCFCGKGGFWKFKGYAGTFDQGYRNDGRALQFIEQAVAEKIERDRAAAQSQGKG